MKDFDAEEILKQLREAKKELKEFHDDFQSLRIELARKYGEKK